MRPRPSIARYLTLILSLLSVQALWARADGPTPAQQREQLQRVAKDADIPHYVRACNGVPRVYLNPSGRQHLQAIERTLTNKSNVLEVCHIGSPNAMHSMVIFDRQLIHIQYIQGTNNWRLRSWGDSLRNSGSKLYSAMVQLTPKEANNLRNMVAAAWKEQGSEWQAGPNWENGHLKVAFGNRGYNCTSVWSGMPLGEKGETLAQILGLGNASGSPTGFQQELETRANDRVVGICVYGPNIPGFANQNGNQFTFGN